MLLSEHPTSSQLKTDSHRKIAGRYYLYLTERMTIDDKIDKNFDRLDEVSKKRAEWATLPAAEKLTLLEEIQTIFSKELEYEDFKANGKLGAKMKGLDVDNTDEGDHEATEEVFLFVLTVKATLEDMIKTYKIRAGLEAPPKKFTKGNFETRKAINGQVVTKTFPIFPEDIKGISNHLVGEVWMDASKIQDESQVEAFAFEKAWDDAAGTEGGLMVVLGAGNQPMLSFADIMHVMYTRNYVVYFKQHPLRNYINTIYERLYAPLISRGYLAIEAHSTNERCSDLIYHPEVDALHMTGGKATHDLLVWGLDAKEREQNLKAKTPKVENVTSELGAITPWVVVPGKYTKAEITQQAKILARFIHFNASCNCNAPKCIVVADEWDQKDQFLKAVEDDLANHPLPVAYYPNVEKRWDTYAARYPDCERIESNTGMGIAERKLSAGGLHDKPLLLPFLKIEVAVNLDTASGKEDALNEYAFKTEPFAPVLTIVTLKGTSQENLLKFSDKASTFCNDYLFGTLSASITTPPSVMNHDGVQHLIADMKYGAIVINNYGGFAYGLLSNGMWGAFPGETLDAVESGTGKIGNSIAIPHFEKFVVTAPIVHPGNLMLPDDLKKETVIYEAISRFSMNSTSLNFVKMIGAVVGVDLVKVGLFGTSAIVAACAYFLR